MDIFTTQLTRVVPVTIQPEKLKVKALLKGEPLGELKEDMKELTASDYAFYHNASQKQQEQHNSPDQQAKKNTGADEDENAEQTLVESTEITQAYDRKTLTHHKALAEDKLSDTAAKEKPKHLDLFV